jgi:hypothetical protein
MKKQYLQGYGCYGLAAVLLACGGQGPDTETLANEFLEADGIALDLAAQRVTAWDGTAAPINIQGIAEVPPLPEGYDPSKPRQSHSIAKVEVDGFMYEFVRVYLPGDVHASPSVSMRTLGPAHLPNPAVELQNSLNVPLTFAEIYSGLTGAPAPDELLQEHPEQSRRLLRDAQFQYATRIPLAEVEKTTDADFTPNIPGHKWIWSHKRDLTFCHQANMLTANCAASSNIVAKFWCTSSGIPSPDGFGVPGPNACPARNRISGWVRSAFYIPVGSSVTAQSCYGPSSDGAWVCYPGFSVSGSQLYIEDWDAVAPHVLAGVLARQEAPATTAKGRIFDGIVGPN